MTLRFRNIQVDVPAEDHELALAWWAGALGGTPRTVKGPYHHLDGVRATIGIHVQAVDAGGGGYHLDLEADDVAAEVDRLVGLGAAEVGAAGGWERGTRLMADPAGLRFCITGEGQPQHVAGDADGLRLQVVMLDVPADVATAQSGFWAASLGGRAVPVGEQYPEYTWIKDVTGPGGHANIAVQTLASGSAGIHVDLHCADEAARDAEVNRLVDLGAEERESTGHWRVLRTPGGPVVCVVPDSH